jgi:hypothetical protein
MVIPSVFAILRIFGGAAMKSVAWRIAASQRAKVRDVGYASRPALFRAAEGLDLYGRKHGILMRLRCREASLAAMRGFAPPVTAGLACM